jgi:hypothetical protein
MSMRMAVPSGSMRTRSAPTSRNVKVFPSGVASRHPSSRDGGGARRRTCRASPLLLGCYGMFGQSAGRG